jgi:uncharacterized protein YnzC (UPF0291/DUF896 family)
VLARLDEVIAPARSAANREGTLLRIEGVADQRKGIGDLVIVTVNEMGFVAEKIDHLIEDVSRWYSVGEIDELSAEEARILAKRWARELRDEGLVGVDESHLRRALKEMLLSSFRRAAKTGIVQVDLADPRGPEGIDPEAFKHIRELLMRKLSGGKHLRTE